MRESRLTPVLAVPPGPALSRMMTGMVRNGPDSGGPADAAPGRRHVILGFAVLTEAQMTTSPG